MIDRTALLQGCTRLLPFVVALLLLTLISTSCVPGSAFWDGFWEGYSGATHSSTPGVVETTVISSFTGLSQGNVYTLGNGQIWEQTEYYQWYWYAYYPRVIIYSSYGVYKMKVEGIDHAVTVRRLR